MKIIDYCHLAGWKYFTDHNHSITHIRT